ncbi:hypothetical protein C8Q75DRAFT_100370 [Abortiporus biennis]|nr:hypothetical protein C8Q75DRAFT_100370 [Abortiporus biennis]
MSCSTCHCCSAQSFIPTGKADIIREIQCHKRALQKLHSQLNSFSPIALLPDELLCKIFAFYAADYGVISQDPDDATYLPYGYLRITHVCQYWRKVAINFSPLWNRIELREYGYNSWQWVVEQLKRSSDLPLTLIITASIHQQQILSKILKQYWHRIEALQLTVGSKETPPKLNKVLQDLSEDPETISILHTLDIRVDQISRSGFSATKSLFPLSARLLSQLRKLTMTDFSPKDTMQFLSPTIRTFKYQDNSSFPVSFGGILDVLDKIPNVEQLVIHASVAMDSTTVLPRRVVLPSLTTLSIVDDDVRTATVPLLLLSLDIHPRILKITISSQFMRHIPDPTYRTLLLADAISSVVLDSRNDDSERRKNFEYLMIKPDRFSLTLLAWALQVDELQDQSIADVFTSGEERDLSELLESEDPYLDATIPIPSPEPAKMAGFFEILDFSAIHILEINEIDRKPFISRGDSWQFAWVGFLSTMPSKELDVLYLHFPRLTPEQYLEMTLDTIWRHDKEIVIKTLVVWGIEFGSSPDSHDGEDYIQIELRRRAEAGVPIETLVIEIEDTDESLKRFSPYVTVGVVDIETTSW